MNEGDTCRLAAILSKPSCSSSRGSSVAASISTPSRSRTELAYSRRFSRCRPTRPGATRWPAAASSVVSSQLIRPFASASLGRSLPGGGIRRPRILRMVASQDLASAGASSRDSASKARPPAQSSVLWQPKQYFCSVSQCEAGTAWPLATPTAPIMNRVDAVTNRLMTLPPLRMVRGIFLELDATAPAGAAQSATQAAAGLWHHDARLLFAAHFPRLFDGLVQCFLNGSGKFRDRILEAGRFHLEAQWQHATRCEKLGLSAVQHRARGIRLAADEHGHQAPDGAGRTVGEYLFLVEAGRVKADLWQLVLVAHALVYPERLTQRCQHEQVGFQQVVLMQAVEADPAQSLAIQSPGLAVEGRHQPQLDFH